MASYIVGIQNFISGVEAASLKYHFYF